MSSPGKRTKVQHQLHTPPPTTVAHHPHKVQIHLRTKDPSVSTEFGTYTMVNCAISEQNPGKPSQSRPTPPRFVLLKYIYIRSLVGDGSGGRKPKLAPRYRARRRLWADQRRTAQDSLRVVSEKLEGTCTCPSPTENREHSEVQVYISILHQEVGKNNVASTVEMPTA